MPANRTKTGQFKKGTSGNPAGRPKRSEVEIETLARICTLAPLAVEAMEEILTDKTISPAVRMKCAETVLDRVCGRPMDAEAIADYEDTPRFDFSSMFKGVL